MKKIYQVLGIGTLSLSLTALAWAQATYTLKINGKTMSGGAIVVKGKTYIPLDALKAAGTSAQITGTTLTLTLPAGVKNGEGGTNQQEGLEGKGGEWLFNGIWRFRVISVEKGTGEGEDHPGWRLKVEVRNGTKYSGYAVNGTGYEGMQLVLEDGTSVEPISGGVDFVTPGIAQGASLTKTLGFETDSASKPVRLVVRFNPEGTANIPLKFSVANPTFRVDIRNILPK
jgi:hypothetical protein